MSAIPSHNLVEGELYEVCLSECGRHSTDHDGVVQILKVPKGNSRIFRIQIISGLEYYLHSSAHGMEFHVGLGSPFHQSMKLLTTTEEKYSIELSFDSLMNQEKE